MYYETEFITFQAVVMEMKVTYPGRKHLYSDPAFALQHPLTKATFQWSADLNGTSVDDPSGHQWFVIRSVKHSDGDVYFDNYGTISLKDSYIILNAYHEKALYLDIDFKVRPPLTVAQTPLNCNRCFRRSIQEGCFSDYINKGTIKDVHR